MEPSAHTSESGSNNLFDFFFQRLIEAAFFGPALTLLVFLRGKLGFRNVRPLMIFAPICMILTSFSLAAIGSKTLRGGQVFSQGWHWLSLPDLMFVSAFFVLAVFQRMKAWDRLFGGDEDNPGHSWHTRHRGVSWLARWVGPMKLNRFQRFVEPIGCFVVGLIVAIISGPLGAWICFSSLLLGLAEAIAFEMQLEFYCIKNDAECDAEAMSEEAREKRSRNTTAAQQHVSVAVPSGLSEELIQLREQRRQRRQQEAEKSPKAAEQAA